MKKLALTLAIVLGLGMASYAEGGGLFGHGQATSNHNDPGNHPAPVGSGIAVLVGLGAAYAFAKKREE